MKEYRSRLVSSDFMFVTEFMKKYCWFWSYWEVRRQWRNIAVRQCSIELIAHERCATSALGRENYVGTAGHREQRAWQTDVFCNLTEFLKISHNRTHPSALRPFSDYFDASNLSRLYNANSNFQICNPFRQYVLILSRIGVIIDGVWIG
jgi:hypothetical protein